MISEKYIKQKEEGELEMLDKAKLCNEYRAYLNAPKLNRSPLFTAEVNKIVGYFLQTKSPTAYLPILTRIREDDTITQRVVLGKVADFNPEEFIEAFNKRKPILNMVASFTSDRIHFTPNVDVLCDKNQLILLYNDKKSGIFQEVITDTNKYIDIKTKMWGLAGKCAKDIKHTNVSYENDGRINIEVKASHFDVNKLGDVPSNDKGVFTYGDIPIKVTAHRLIYNYK